MTSLSVNQAISAALYDPDKMDGRPQRLSIYGASDYATMEPRKGRKEPDFSEHGVWGLEGNNHLWALDWWSGQYETDKSIAAFIKLVQQWKPSYWWNEGSLIDKAIGPQIRAEMTLNRAWTVVESLTSILDKGAKLQAFHAMAAAGCIHFPIRRRWADQVIEQLIKFPGGRWDDKADVCGLIARGIDSMIAPPPPPALPPRDFVKPFTEAWLMHNDRNRKPKVRYF